MPYAILSVHDKTGLVDFAFRLSKMGWSFLASGGTARTLLDAGISVREIADYTGAREILGGRVKTLHPAIHGGILARGTGADLQEIEALGYVAVDMVVVNLYPFEKTVADPRCSLSDAIEQIDIGGVALIRAAAKNNERVAILSDVADYAGVLRELEASGTLSATTRRRLAVNAFGRTSRYDAAINAWLATHGNAAAGSSGEGATQDEPPVPELPAQPERQPSLALTGVQVQKLRYGENPHQGAELYSFVPGQGPLGGKILQGKELSYNNILDLDAAWHAAGRFANPAVVIVKHLSPCGISESSPAGNPAPATLAQALQRAIDCDPISAFGGVIAVNSPFDATCASTLGSLFVECIAAPSFTAEALAILSAKKNLRLVIPGKGVQKHEIRTVLGGFLRQDVDAGDPAAAAWKVVSKRQPTETELRDLEFAWKACMSAKSNAIVFAKAGATIGIGSGQPNRVDSVRIAATRAGAKAQGAVLASDAFFPFPDSVEEAAKAGITAIAHPGGSMRDPESLAAADAAGIAMVLTGVRHFRH
jgi:phosphoribosylaminoimidazolecarboxamide formyltransferase/IMP cyclohydrolase